MLLKGVIDCPDLPLNVSRSALQNDGFVKKISDYITTQTPTINPRSRNTCTDRITTASAPCLNQNPSRKKRAHRGK